MKNRGFRLPKDAFHIRPAQKFQRYPLGDAAHELRLHTVSSLFVILGGGEKILHHFVRVPALLARFREGGGINVDEGQSRDAGASRSFSFRTSTSATFFAACRQLRQTMYPVRPTAALSAGWRISQLQRTQ